MNKKRNYFFIFFVITASCLAMEEPSESIVPYDIEKHQVFVRHLLAHIPKELLESGSNLDEQIENTLNDLEKKYTDGTYELNKEIYLKFVNDLPIGFINFATSYPTIKGIVSSLPFEIRGFITLLAINPHYRKKGYGKELLELAIKKIQTNMEQSRFKFQKTAVIYLNTVNTDTHSLYEKVGFQLSEKKNNKKTFTRSVNIHNDDDFIG